jgi:cysteine desulfurase / selenocysteine lyase
MIYLNNTATSFPKPPEVTEAIIEFLKCPPCHSSRSGLERDAEDIDYACRIKLSKLFNSPDPSRVIFASGSTEALNLAINGLELNNCHVVSTAIEHNSVIRPLKTLEQRGAIEITFVECDSTAYVEPKKIEEAITENTKVVVVNHCSNVTGSTLDLKAISDVAHKNNCVFIVDASQSAGMLPIDISGWDIDLFAFTGHKSLFGLPGIGGLVIKEGIELRPLKVGGTGILSEILTQPEGYPIHYEAGTPNLPGIVSLNAGVEFILKTGTESIHKRKVEIVNTIINELIDVRGISIYNNPERSSFSNFCFNIKGMVPEEVNYMLEESYDIHVRSGLHCAPLLLEALGVHPWGTVRCSPSYFTQDWEVEKFIIAVKEMANMFSKK